MAGEDGRLDELLKPLNEEELLRIVETIDWEKIMEEERKWREELRRTWRGYRPRCSCGHRYK